MKKALFAGGFFNVLSVDIDFVSPIENLKTESIIL